MSLINDVLDMRKIDQKDIMLLEESVNLRDVIENCRDILEAKAGEQEITLDTTGMAEFNPPQLTASEVHLRQIFMNIISNAIKYNKYGGKIFIQAIVLEQTEDKVTCRFSVTDTGIGMSEDFQKQMFEPFTQEHAENRSSYQGTGLGMSIVKNLINKMKGTITLETKQGEGSTFTITLPVKLDTVCFEETETEEEETSIEGMKILLVEDNDLNLEVAQYILEDAGAEIIVARNGLESVELFEQSESDSFDVILMDVMMPVMDGLTATKRIRKLKRKDARTVPVIAMTANVFNEDIIAAKEAGMNEHIAKPLDFDKLIHTLAKYFLKMDKKLIS